MHFSLLLLSLTALLPFTTATPLLPRDDRAPATPSTSTSTPEAAAKVPATLKGIDMSGEKTLSFMKCAAKHYQVAALRGYAQYCNEGGGVDLAFVKNYQLAKEAGIKRIDAYLYPCSSPTNGKQCKAPQTQLNELLAAIKKNKMTITRYWFDIEPTSISQPNVPCNSWQNSKAENEKLAKEWVALLKKTKLPWGVYANGNQWTGMFAERSTDVASSLPLWAVQDDGNPSISSTNTLMGGWKKANVIAKQYNLNINDPYCGTGVDLDSFYKE